MFSKKIKINKKIGYVILGAFLIIGSFGVNNFVFAQACPSNSVYSDTQATLVGEITNTGGDQNIKVWFEWGRSYSLTNTTPIQYLNVTYTPYKFCYTITGLSPCTTYYYRAVAQNSAGTNYGEIKSFTTTCYAPSQTYTYSTPLYASCSAYPNPAYVGDVVNFNSTVTGGTGIYTYYWSGDCTGNSAICQKVFYNPGTYYAYLTVYSGGDSRTVSCSVNVISRPTTQQTTYTSTQTTNQKPVAEITYSPQNITPGTLVKFSALNSYDPDGSIIFYEWQINGEIVSRSPTFSRALSAGTYKIKLTVVDDKGATASKELIISVGRTQFITRTVTQTVTKTVRIPVPQPTSKTSQAVTAKTTSNFVDISLDESLSASVCSKGSLNVTILNNSSQKKSITFTVSGEVKKWFKPKARIIEVLSNDVTSFDWAFEIPCDTEEGEYYGIITASINGVKKDFPINISVAKNKGIFSPLTASIGRLFEGISFSLLLIIILILINIVMWYYLFVKGKEKPKIE